MMVDDRLIPPPPLPRQRALRSTMQYRPHLNQELVPELALRFAVLLSLKAVLLAPQVKA
jgi:hypothetical protein